MLILAISLVTLALLLYTIGTWVEKYRKILNASHLIIFWTGFICDLGGTLAMKMLAPANVPMNIHTLIGILSIFVMFAHNVYASIVLKTKDENRRRTFPKISLIAWGIWVLSYWSGVFLSMGM